MSIFQATRGAHLEDGIVHLMMTRVFPDVSFDGSLVLAAVAADCTAKPSSRRIMHKGGGLCVLTGVLCGDRFYFVRGACFAGSVGMASRDRHPTCPLI